MRKQLKPVIIFVKPSVQMFDRFLNTPVLSGKSTIETLEQGVRYVQS